MSKWFYMNVVLIIFLAIIVIFVIGFGFNRFAALLEVKRLIKEETPQAWMKILAGPIEQSKMTDTQIEQLWFFIKKTLSLTDLNSEDDGHISIEHRLKTLFLYFNKFKEDKNMIKWIQEQRDIRITLESAPTGQIKTPYIQLTSSDITVVK